jgi:hypothetical protein
MLRPARLPQLAQVLLALGRIEVDAELRELDRDRRLVEVGVHPVDGVQILTGRGLGLGEVDDRLAQQVEAHLDARAVQLLGDVERVVEPGAGHVAPDQRLGEAAAVRDSLEGLVLGGDEQESIGHQDPL